MIKNHMLCWLREVIQINIILNIHMKTSKKQLTPRDLNWTKKSLLWSKMIYSSIGIYYLFLKCSQELSFVVKSCKKITHDTLNFDGILLLFHFPHFLSSKHSSSSLFSSSFEMEFNFFLKTCNNMEVSTKTNLDI